MTNEELDRRRSLVRVLVTYIAAAFLFGGGAILIGYFALFAKDMEKAITLFTTILPVSASIISFWFGTRGSNNAK